ncbi:MAG: deoxyribodipyrimidine photo-lyase [Cytophagales bacterium]
MRRDLRLFDNHGLYRALKDRGKVLVLFIFDKKILDELEDEEDKRLLFIHQELEKINKELQKYGSSLISYYGYPEDFFQGIKVKAVYTNHDYEPYAIERDQNIKDNLVYRGIAFHSFKDQVVFEKDEIVKDNGEPYSVFTPYSRKWLEAFRNSEMEFFSSEDFYDSYAQIEAQKLIPLEEMGFKNFNFEFPDRTVDKNLLKDYNSKRNLPAEKGTSRLSIHFRFGTISIREMTQLANQNSTTWLNELIWRNFYMVILWHHPHVVDKSFKPAYDKIEWRNNESEFEAWCEGKTGYPIVDAGMRQLNQSGYMHNRVRMITASFLTKHLLIDWRWGEAYFAKKLMDYELASNNGGWQWASGSGCDAAPYFRVFNPELQTKKFDPDMKYIKKWIPEFESNAYPKPIVEHKMARERALDTYKSALNS